MIVSRRWCALLGCISLCSATLVTHLRADEVQVAVEVDGDVVEVTAESAVEAAAPVESPEDGAPDAKQAEADLTGSKPTHKQSSLIKINAEGLSESSVKCFCLTGDDALLAGCDGPATEIRVFGADGKFVRSIELPVKPEAINVAPDGTILVAGEGKLLRISSDDRIVAEADAPHAESLRTGKEKLREEVIEQHKEQAGSMPQMLKAYDEAIANLQEQLDKLGDDEAADAQRTTLEQTITTYKDAKEQLADQFGDEEESAELTEDKIAELVDSSLQYKMTVASISATDEAVFIATRAPLGYGYDVWRTTTEFADAEKIVTGLSGCCGQMDVQANADGVFVAENSRKRVRRFDAAGKTICDWGKSSEGVEGFGSCCNPMNLAFGADGSVYTAEDTTGRIKRYSVDGKLLSVVGAADVVPGCKKTSIGVDSTGDRVYALDITRNTVAVLSRVRPDPTGPIVDTEASSTVAGGLLRWLGLD